MVKLNPEIITQDPKMTEVLAIAESVASSKAPVMILGRPGVGKRSLAAFILKHSNRLGKPTFVYDCRTEKQQSGNTFEQSLDQSEWGTLILHEVGKLSIAHQRYLFEKMVSGWDVRVLSTSSQDLQALVQNGAFLEELLFKLNIVTLKIPTLSERWGDLQLMIENAMSKAMKTHQKLEMSLSEEALEVLKGYNWPGNVRELEGVIERAVVLCKETMISGREVQLITAQNIRRQEEKRAAWKPGKTLDEIERNVILEALNFHSGNRTHTAKALGISIRTLRNKLAEYRVLGIQV